VLKDWLLIALSVLLFQTPVSNVSLMGYLVAFAGVKYWDARRVADIKNAADIKAAAVVNSTMDTTRSVPHSPTADMPLLEQSSAESSEFGGAFTQGATQRQST
jgi:hypothetical protein